MGATHILINGIPKSGTSFLAHMASRILGCERTRIASQGLTQSQADVQQLSEFMARPKGVSKQHIAPTDYNVALLRELGLRRFALTLRDPRDVIVSLAHHLRRTDLVPWYPTMVVASGLVPADHERLPWERQLDALIELGFPKLQAWTRTWLEIVDADTGLEVHLVDHHRFARDPDRVCREMMEFFGYPVPTGHHLLPQIGPQRDGGGGPTRPQERRATAGSFRDELNVAQRERLSGLVDRDLYSRMEWPT